MKKIIAMLLAAVLCLGLLAGCSSAKSSSAAADSDLAYIKQKGTLVIGITEFEPIDYQDEKGNWIGFDADMATAFAESLGVKPVFQIINWDNKAMELDGKTIDVVWNGMTLNDEVKAAMSCSNPYFNNAQVAVVKAADKDKYATVESLKDAQFAVENGSAGQKQVTALGYKFTPVEDQATALTEVQSGTSDAAVIDLLMAKSTIGEGTSYANLTYTAKLNSEEYGVGFRKGSDAVEALNKFFKEKYDDGTMKKLCGQYDIEADTLIEQK